MKSNPSRKGLTSFVSCGVFRFLDGRGVSVIRFPLFTRPFARLAWKSDEISQRRSQLRPYRRGMRDKSYQRYGVCTLCSFLNNGNYGDYVNLIFFISITIMGMYLETYELGKLQLL